MSSVLVLNRPPLIHMPYAEWLGPEHDVRIITSVGSVNGTETPAGTVVVEGYDASGLVELIALELYRERPFDHIIALSEYDLLRAARLRDVLGLPGQHYDGALAFRDKVVMKDHWRAAGVPITGYAALDSATDLVDFADEHGYPVVVKPRRGTGSRAVYVLRSHGELRAWLAEVWSLALCDVSTWMAEIYVQGEMLHVDGLWNGGRLEIAWPSCLSSMLGFQEGQPGLSAMLDADDPLIPASRELLRRCITALSPDDLMIFHAELWLLPDGRLLLNEIASRQGGGKIGPATRAAFGVHMMRRYSRGMVDPSTLDAEHVPDRPLRTAGWAVVPPGHGIVQRADRPDGVFPREWMLDASVVVRPGQAARGAEGSMESAASCLVVGADNAQVLDRLAQFVKWAGSAIEYAEL